VSSPEQVFVEQYLLFDHTEYIEGIKHVGEIALIELIGDETEPVHEVFQLPVWDDNSPRLFE